MDSPNVVSFLTELRDPLRFALLLFLLWAIWRNFQVRAQYVGQHPPVAYVPPAGGMGIWRFGPIPAELSADLQRIDEPEASRIVLPERSMITQRQASWGGWALMALGLVWLVREVVAPGDVWAAAVRFSMPSLLVLAGFGLTYVDVNVRTVELTPERATFIGRHGFVFYQRIVLKRRPGTGFAGDTQSALTMHTRDQTSPNFILIASTGWGRTKRLMFMCTPAQGAWIRDALKHWSQGGAT